MSLADQLLALSVPHLAVFTMALARVGGLLAIGPILGSLSTPVRVRAALAFFLTIAMLPVLPAEAATAFAPATGPLGLTAGLAREAGIGFTIGVVAQFVFGGVQLAGQLAGIQMGLGLANLIDPHTQEHITSLAQWQQLLALMVFLAVDGHHLLIRAVAQSFAILPVGGGLPAAAGLSQVVLLAGDLFVIAVKISAPVMVLLLLVNGAMGVLGKLIPQLNILVVGFPLNIAAGIFALAAAQPFTIRLLANAFDALAPKLALILAALR